MALNCILAYSSILQTTNILIKTTYYKIVTISEKSLRFYENHVKTLQNTLIKTNKILIKHEDLGKELRYEKKEKRRRLFIGCLDCLESLF